MTTYEKLLLQRNNELAEAAKAAAAGDVEMLNFHTSAAVGFELRIHNMSVEDLEQEA